VLKIPGHGTAQRWTAEDEHMFTREVEILEVLTRFKNTPSPKPLVYSTTLTNQFGFPYIITNRLRGESADSIWYDPDVERNHLTADVPSLPTEMKRITFLRSLAKIMTELNVIPQFEGIGTPSPGFGDVAQTCTDVRTLPVREYYKWANPDNLHEAEKRGPFGSAAEYIQQYRDERYN